jgi:hypothetical protein
MGLKSSCPDKREPVVKRVTGNEFSRKHMPQRCNEEAARIILADAERYAGLPLEWARLWMERRENSRNGPQAALKSLAA